MSIYGIKKWALLLTFWVALQGKWARATDLSGNNLTLTGTADIQGNTISLGTGSGSNPGWQGTYTDGTTSYVDFMGTRDANIWRWWQNAAGTAQLQLTLDNNNTVTLYDQSSTPVAKIILNPLGASSIANSLTVNGTDNQMPNQTLTGSNSVLTEGLADGRYLTADAADERYVSTSGTSFALGGTATGYNAIAFGTGASASGYEGFAAGADSMAASTESVAIGVFTSVYGAGSLALGNGDYSFGNSSAALGAGVTAVGNQSTAVGYETTTEGDGSVAMGVHTTTSGTYSTAMGYWTRASAYDSTAMGQYNVNPSSNTHGWTATDPLFELGNGTDLTHTSDALIIYKNGNATLQGTLTASALTGTIVNATTITATTVMTTTAAGDVPMFGH